jgi:NAD(P)-dependent dehydrogenase (short-subunit alcohol dehydrogenase family)
LPLPVAPWIRRFWFERIQSQEERAAVTADILNADGRLDILVNNARISGLESGRGARDPENATLEDWRAVHRTNLDGVFLGCNYTIRAMLRTGSIMTSPIADFSLPW